MHKVSVDQLLWYYQPQQVLLWLELFLIYTLQYQNIAKLLTQPSIYLFLSIYISKYYKKSIETES